MPEPEIVEDAGLNLVFVPSLQKGKWRDLLNNLASRQGAVLRVGAKDLPGVKTSAKKLGLKLEFAKQGEVVYVKVAGTRPLDPKEIRRRNILEALKDAPRDAGQITQYLRSMKGDNVTDATMCDCVLMQLSKAGIVEMGKDKKWRRVVGE